MASSRVGVRMIARGFFFSVCPPASAARVGRPKESVLPEPVRPRPRMSLPARASGMVAAWIGKGVVTPFCASLRTTPSGSPRSAKVTLGSASSAASSAVSAAEVSATGVSSAWATTASAASTTSMFSTSFSGMTVWSELEIDMRNAKPSGVSARARNSVFSQFRPPQCGPATARESTRHTALFCVGAGQWDQAIYYHTHPPPHRANRPPSHRCDLR